MEPRLRLRRGLSLRHTVAVWLGVGFLLLSGLHYHVTGALLTRQLFNEESRGAFTRVRNLHNILAVLSSGLRATTSDWARRSAVHEFVAGATPGFADTLSSATFRRLQLSFMLIVDGQGRVVYARTCCGPGDTLEPLSEDVVHAAARAGLLDGGERRDEVLSDFIEGSGDVHLVSSSPLQDTQGAVQGRGRLLMGRSMTTTLLPIIERMTQVRLRLLPADAALPSDTAQEILANEFGDELHLYRGTALGYTILQGQAGNALGRLEMELPRPVEAMLASARPYLVAITVLIAFVFYGVALFVVEYKVIDPMEKLAAAVSGIDGASPALARVTGPGRENEFGTLAAAINSMLDQIEAQQSLARDRDAALEANRLKSEFLAVISHEIRTPMNGVLGMCELLQRTELDARQRHLADTLLRSARSLLEILNDILDFSKIEAGKLQLEVAPFSPAEVIQSTAAPFAAAAQSKHVEFKVNIDPQVPPWLLGDALRLRQILNNLLSNAVKFTHRGSIVVTCSVDRAHAHRVDLQISVADTGIGIAENVQWRVFDPFRQAEPGTAHRYGGTGLGLAIVKRLVDLMHGHVWIESAPGCGSTFTVTVGLKPVGAASLPQKTPSATATGARFTSAHAPAVLLAEDNAINREVLTEMLEYFGCRVTAVENGAEAVAAVAASRFDIVLLDCQMPVMDGHAAAAELRALERAAGQEPTLIVALTADATVENRERCFASGMDAVITKPVSHVSLRELVMQRRVSPDASAHHAS